MGTTDYDRASELLASIYATLPDNAVSVMSDDEKRAYEDYRRWAIGPLGTARQWLAMHRVAMFNWPSWRVLNNI